MDAASSVDTLDQALDLIACHDHTDTLFDFVEGLYDEDHTPIVY